VDFVSMKLVQPLRAPSSKKKKKPPTQPPLPPSHPHLLGPGSTTSTARLPPTLVRPVPGLYCSGRGPSWSNCPPPLATPPTTSGNCTRSG
jgi:hypothetical protein